MYIVIYNVTVKHIKIYIYTATDVSKIEDKPTHLFILLITQLFNHRCLGATQGAINYAIFLLNK